MLAGQLVDITAIELIPDRSVPQRGLEMIAGWDVVGTREFNFEVQFPIKNQAAFRSSSKTTC
ncbi:hypothetical protein, partial [Aeromonas hydrophila]